MTHKENKSQIWFKILSPENLNLDCEDKKWILPSGTKKGEWFISGARMGTLLVSNPAPFLLKHNQVFVVELSKEDPIIEVVGLIWVRKARMVRAATNLDLKRFGIYRAFQQIV